MLVNVLARLLGAGILGCFALVLVALPRAMHPAVRELGYAPAAGAVTVSEPVAGTPHDYRLEYRYPVGDREYPGGGVKSAAKLRRSTRESILKANPVGKPRPVWYDPAAPTVHTLEEPSLASLLCGFQLVALFPTPVVLLGLVLVSGAWPSARTAPPAGGGPGAVRLSVYFFTRDALWYFVITGFTAFVFAAFGLTVLTREPAGGRVGVVFLIAAMTAEAAVFGALTWRLLVPPRLGVDPAAGELRFRPRWLWPRPESVRLADVTGVEVTERPYTDKSRSYIAGGVVVVHRDGRLMMPEHETREEADAVAGWVRSYLPAGSATAGAVASAHASRLHAD